MKTKRSSALILSIAVIAVALGLVLWPLAKPGFFVSDDGEWMVIRLSAFYQSLAAGQIPVRFLGRLNNSYGYPVANFLYPGFLYIGSFFRFLGFSFPDAVKLILGLSVVTAAYALFSAIRTRFTLVSSVIGALSFVFAPYLLYDLYGRGSVGELLALCAASLALLALAKGWTWLMAPAIGLLIISHNTVALIAGLGIASLIVIDTYRYQMLVSAAFGVGMSAFFWLPALAEKGLVRFDLVQVSDPSQYFIGIQNAERLGLVTVLSLTIFLGLTKKVKLQDKVMAGLVAIGLLLSLPLSAPLWNGPVAPLVQFPYRFLILPVLFGPWIVAAIIEQLKGRKRILLMVIFVLLCARAAVTQLSQIQFVHRLLGFYTTNEATTNVANEYMPRWVSDIPTKRAVETLEVIAGDTTLSERTFPNERIRVEVDAKEISTVQINKIYYPGWGVTIDNQLVPIDYHNALGVMRIEVPQGAHTVEAAFRETPFRFAADLVSLISFIGFIVLIRRLRVAS